jgi:hypothetical protein
MIYVLNEGILRNLLILAANYDGWIKRSPYGRVRVNIK